MRTRSRWSSLRKILFRITIFSKLLRRSVFLGFIAFFSFVQDERSHLDASDQFCGEDNDRTAPRFPRTGGHFLSLCAKLKRERKATRYSAPKTVRLSANSNGNCVRTVLVARFVRLYENCAVIRAT